MQMKWSYILIFLLTEHKQLNMICARVENEVRSGFVMLPWANKILLEGTHLSSESQQLHCFKGNKLFSYVHMNQ
jgi:hypothetical protein